MERQTIAALGIGWLTASVVVIAAYAVPLPDLLKVVVAGLSGFGATLFWMNR